jgi:hydroxymethylpyrimidine pyrophosphatase-like HAD family hydrolase
VVDHLQTLPNIEIIACGKRSAYTLNRYNDALKTVAAKYYHRLELVDDFNHLDDTILKFGLNVPDSLIPEIQPKLHAALGDMVTAVATGYGSIDLIIPGVHKANGCAFCSSAGALRIRGGGVRRQRQRYRNAAARRVWLCHGQRPEDVKAVARYHAPHNNEEGVLQIIDKVLNREAPFA